MKKRLNTFLLIIVLLLFSIVFVYLQIIIFGNPKETFFLIIQDLIFLPINIIIVTLVIGEIFKNKERNSRILKLNILINEFFSEAGNSLILSLNLIIDNYSDIKSTVNFSSCYPEKKLFKQINSTIEPKINILRMNENLISLYHLLDEKKHIIISMFENPNILEHDSFTNMLLATHHLLDELRIRDDLMSLEEDDAAHIANDIKRAYIPLVREFVSYMKHLKREYPYIHSLVIRKNIF